METPFQIQDNRKKRMIYLLFYALSGVLAGASMLQITPFNLAHVSLAIILMSVFTPTVFFPLRANAAYVLKRAPIVFLIGLSLFGIISPSKLNYAANTIFLATFLPAFIASAYYHYHGITKRGPAPVDA